MIKFKNISIQNFLSFGNTPTEIKLDEHQTTLIVGRNGAGKSTLLDAISFVLYGKPHRNINKPQLINSINGKDCLVQILFTIGKNEYIVRRGIKPALFEVYENGELLNQDAKTIDQQEYFETNILQMNHTAFTQIVVLGKTSYVPFMRLKTAERRHLIEELLGLTIFSKMNEVLKRRVSNLKDKKQELTSSIAVIEEKIRLRQKYIDQLSVDKNQHKKNIDIDISKTTEHIDQATKELDSVLLEKATLIKLSDDYKKLKSRKSQFSNLSVEFESKIRSVKKDINFFNDNAVCPTCKQEISEEFKHETIKTKENVASSLNADYEKLKSTIEDLKKQIDEKNVFIEKLRVLDVDENGIKVKLEQLNKTLRSLTSKRDEISVSGDIERETAELDFLNSELATAHEEMSVVNSEFGHYQSISTMLKDTGIKSLIVQKYLPIFNALINEYLTKFDFFVKFELDDTFNETILSRHKDKFSYSSFSEGERLRIDLAILLTWREISKMKNAMSTNLLIMDEVFDSSLDQTGVDAFIDIIPSMEKANIFVISHTPSKLYDKFKHVIEIEKPGNFSIIQQ